MLDITKYSLATIKKIEEILTQFKKLGEENLRQSKLILVLVNS